MEYKVLTASTLAELTDVVQAAMESGWIPQGGVTTRSQMEQRFLQAMVKTGKRGVRYG